MYKYRMCNCMYRYYASKFHILWPWSCRDQKQRLVLFAWLYPLLLVTWGGRSNCRLAANETAQQKRNCAGIEHFHGNFARADFNFYLSVHLSVSKYVWGTTLQIPFTSYKANVKICLKTKLFNFSINKKKP